jgi:hypothetical protein
MNTHTSLIILSTIAIIALMASTQILSIIPHVYAGPSNCHRNPGYLHGEPLFHPCGGHNQETI